MTNVVKCLVKCVNTPTLFPKSKLSMQPKVKANWAPTISNTMPREKATPPNQPVSQDVKE